MGMSVSRKIIARSAGRRAVEAGDHVVCVPDRAMTYDPQGGPLHRRFREHWGSEARLFDPDRLILVADHFLDLANPAHRARQDELDGFAKAYGIRNYFPVGAANYGVCHAVLPEEGLVRPGELIAGTDSHSSTYGGFGAIGLNVGVDAMEGILATGEHWIEIPPELRIEISGRFPDGVAGKDVALRLCADLANTPAAFGAAIELDGEAVQALHPEDKLTVANMAQEMGARWLLIPPDGTVCDWVGGLVGAAFAPIRPDPDAEYASVLRYRGEEFSRLVALPGGPERATPLAGLPPTRFNEVFVGSCTGAKRRDFEVLFGRLGRVGPAAGLSLMLVPASRKAHDWIFADPDRAALVKATGIRVAEHPGCNACAGIHGFIADGEAVRLSTANRNYAGRMWAPGAQVYLGSPLTAAEIALAGGTGR